VSAGIKSPYVVTVTDVDQTESNVPFLVMELLTGEVLGDRLAREPVLPVAFSAEILVQVLLALEAAHAASVIHRDMKPENVFLTKSSGVFGANSSGLLAKVLDFGIAKLRTIGEVQAHLTRPGSVMGTPEYMAPEQIKGERGGARSDIYAVGCLLYHMLSGNPPYTGDNPLTIMYQHMTKVPEPIISALPDMHPGTWAAIRRALRRRKEERYLSAGEMAEDLRHPEKTDLKWIDEPDPPLATVLPTKRNNALIMAGAVVAAVLLTLLFVFLRRH
jgi:serine/threonine-protein kinase